ncbi:MAG: biopolymer transporter ExbD [Planctomycetota bacterium]
MPLKTTGSEPLQLNLTPMIDVVFLLVIFFMTATQFAEVERAIELELPTVAEDGASVATPDQPSIVSVLADGRLLLGEREVDPPTLTSDLKQAVVDDAEHSVLIQCDAAASAQQWAHALAACRAAGVSDVGVSVETVADIRPLVR